MYSSNDILKAMEQGRIYISPFERSNLNPNSYDVTLDKVFFILTNAPEKLHSPEPYYKGPFIFEPGDYIFLQPAATILGRTFEVVGTTVNVVAQIRAKSSTGRTGKTVCADAGFGDVGYWAKWTVELVGHGGEHKPYLIVGNRFAQMIFDETPTPPVEEYTGQYRMPLAADDGYLNMIPKAYRENIITPTQADYRVLRYGV